MTQRIFSITPEKLVTAAAQLKAATGIDIDPKMPSGRVTTHGVTLLWIVTPGQLAVTILDKPFFIPASTIFDQIATHLE